MYDFENRIAKAGRDAAAQSGQSDVLFEKLLQAAYAAILEAAPSEDRAATEARLIEAGYEPDYIGYQAAEGECSLTGINVDCCPCGRHP